MRLELPVGVPRTMEGHTFLLVSNDGEVCELKIDGVSLTSQGGVIIWNEERVLCNPFGNKVELQIPREALRKVAV